MSRNSNGVATARMLSRHNDSMMRHLIELEEENRKMKKVLKNYDAVLKVDNQAKKLHALNKKCKSLYGTIEFQDRKIESLQNKLIEHDLNLKETKRDSRIIKCLRTIKEEDIQAKS